MNEQNVRDFKGIWIPKEIWLSEDLSLQEKVFLVEIDSLDNENGCFATNDYFSKFFDLSKGRCSEVINSLKEKGKINITFIYKDGTQAIDKRIIKCVKNAEEGIRKSEEGIRKVEGGYSENTKDNNININNTINNTINETTNKPTKNNCPQQVVDKYNEICKSFTKAIKLTPAREKAINARLNEKDVTLETFKELFNLAEDSDFLKGNNDRGFKADLDWLIKPNNFYKTLERKYNKNKTPSVKHNENIEYFEENGIKYCKKDGELYKEENGSYFKVETDEERIKREQAEKEAEALYKKYGF